MEKTLTAIVLRTTDRGESDKIVRLFSAEEGMLDAVMRGVRKAKAKLKFAAQPLAVCSYELAERCGRYTVTGAALVEDTYSLCLEPSLLAAASVVAEIAERAAQSLDGETLFLMLLKSIKTLMLYPDSRHIVLIKLAQKILSLSGFAAPPERTEHAPDTPARLLSYVAYKTLAEAASEEYDESIAKRAALNVLSRIESVYETTLGSKKVYKELA